MFRVIEGGRGASSAETAAALGPAMAIKAEGFRRLREAGIERYEARERLTGIAMPTPLRHFKLQIEFAVQTLSQLSPLPADFATDGYWPVVEGRVTRQG